MKHRALFTILLTLAACAGAEGATGPQGPPGPGGPAGPQGAPGTENRLIVTAVADAFGDAGAILPAAVGGINTPPSVSCYQTDNPAGGVWLAVAGAESTGTFCGLGFTSGSWGVAMLQMTPGWTAAWVVTY